MTTIVDLDTGQVLGVVDGRDHKGVGDWLFARSLQWRLGVAVDHIHLVSLANQGVTEARQNLSRQVKGRRGRGIDKSLAHRMLLLSAGDPRTGNEVHRLAGSSPPMTRPASCKP